MNTLQKWLLVVALVATAGAFVSIIMDIVYNIPPASFAGTLPAWLFCIGVAAIVVAGTVEIFNDD